MDLDFNADEHEPLGDFEVLPAGEYLAIVTGSEEKITKKGDGSYLALTWEVIADQGKGRLLWCNLNLKNPNPKAVDIAHRELAGICKAMGLRSIRRSEELHNKPALLKVGVEEYNGKPKNAIKGYSAPGSVTKSADNSAVSSSVDESAPWDQ